jgi:membrane peptidoglycan carboxypeptidase
MIRRLNLVKLIRITVILGMALIVGLIWGYSYFVVRHPGDQIARDNIMRLISVESPVYYADGKSILGVFFEQQHRRYLKMQPTSQPGSKLPLNSEDDYIPKVFAGALVAAEDKNFYHHPGIDVWGIARAMLANLRAMRVVQGGSTLTQQAAKNIFRRKERSLDEKLLELLNALRLEHFYSKDEILEFYCNQFYVNGTGRGIGVAAEYYFNKLAKDLTLEELAFIAGSVKGPSRYKPVVKQDEREKKATLERARIRTGYVLGRMLDLKMISANQYEIAKNRPLKFEQGQFRYANSVILDFIRDQLQTDYFKKILDDYGISNLATSGIKVYTTIDEEIQNGAEYALRSHTSNLETILHGYKKPDEKAQKEFNTFSSLQAHQFYLGRIVKIEDKGVDSSILVDFGNVQGIVDKTALEKFCGKLNSYKNGGYAHGSPADFKTALALFQEKDIILTSVRELSKDSGQAQLDIEQDPTVQGGVVVLEKGEIRAMVGGNPNINYNRAMYAKREPGSVFKPLLYLAALTLGWNNLDEIYNKRTVFVFQNQFYFPRPDHTPESDSVSMTMAGARSENVASVYLLFNLLSKLTKEQFFKVAEIAGMLQQENESYDDYVKRIRDQMGILPATDEFKRGIFELAKEEFITDLSFLKEDEQVHTLRFLNYGAGYEEKISEINQKFASNKKLSAKHKQEMAIQREILKDNYLRLRKISEGLKPRLDAIRQGLVDIASSNNKVVDPERYQILFKNFYFYPTELNKKPYKIIYTSTPPSDPNLTELTLEDEINLAAAYHGTNSELNLLDPDNILVENTLSIKLIDAIAANIDDTLVKLQQYEPYDPERLYYHRDFRTMVGLRYVIQLLHLIGIDSDLKPVLSLPLGSNSVALYEVAKAYQTMLAGQIYRFNPTDNGNSLALIRRIEDSEGNRLYEYQPTEANVINPELGYLVSSILRQVVLRGTGSMANKMVKVVNSTGKSGNGAEFAFPVFGKTGTTNKYTNATFVGFLPGLSQGEGAAGFDLTHAYTIASYVGNDDNRPMVSDKKTLKIAGSSGALPAWIGTANAIIKAKDFASHIDFVDMAFQVDNMIPVGRPAGIIDVPVDAAAGLPGAGGIEEAFGISFETLGKTNGEEYDLARFFLPITAK